MVDTFLTKCNSIHQIELFTDISSILSQPFNGSIPTTSNTSPLSSHLRIWRSMDPSGLGCSTSGHLWTSYLWKLLEILKMCDIFTNGTSENSRISDFQLMQSVTSWKFLPSFKLFCTWKLLGVSWIPWIPWHHFWFTWRWRSTCGPSWLLLNLRRGLSLKSLRHLEEGVSNQSFVASLYW